MKIVYAGLVTAVLIIGGVLVWRNTGNRAGTNLEVSASPTPIVTPTTSPVTSSTPIRTPVRTPVSSKSTPKPTPGIIITEGVSYDAWVKWLDPLNRWLVLDKDCTSIVPSQVDYPNNVEVMLDNSASAKARVLKIGDKNYSLNARSWVIVTLHTESLPAKLKMFCENMELGQLDLVAQ